MFTYLFVQRCEPRAGQALYKFPLIIIMVVIVVIVVVVQAVVRQHLERWCQTSWEQGHVLGFPACQQLSLDLSLELVLGVGMDEVHREGLSGAMRQFVACLFSLPLVLPGTGVWKVVTAFTASLSPANSRRLP